VSDVRLLLPEESMKAHIHIEEVPCTLVAEAYVVLPGDERVAVALTVARDQFGMPTLAMDFEAAHTILLDRAYES
jgi:hypothetical protein